jgi:hypothetical protein
MRLSNRSARRVRFHCGWLAGVFALCEVLASSWAFFDGLLPISPLAYAGLGLGFGIASMVGHYLIPQN